MSNHTTEKCLPMYRVALVCALVAVVALVVAEPAIAGPGGKIARAAFETFWGRLVLGVLVIVFLPLILLSIMKERRAARRAQSDLAYLATFSSSFRWLDLREQVLTCFHRVHAAWTIEDVREAAEYMTDWYWQNQQLVFLDRWAREGLVNCCDVKSVGRVRPILVDPKPHAPGLDGSKVVISISANLQDYLARRADGEVIEGSKKYKDVETLWSFELTEGRWRVSNIDEGESIDEYLDLLPQMPRASEVVKPQDSTG